MYTARTSYYTPMKVSISWDGIQGGCLCDIMGPAICERTGHEPYIHTDTASCVADSVQRVFLDDGNRHRLGSKTAAATSIRPGGPPREASTGNERTTQFAAEHGASRHHPDRPSGRRARRI